MDLAQMAWVQILALLVTSCVTGQQRHLCASVFPLTERDDMVSVSRARFHKSYYSRRGPMTKLWEALRGIVGC